MRPDQWTLLRTVRLEALRDAPEAFRSTFGREACFVEADWMARFSDDRVNYLGYLPGLSGRPVGLVGGLRELGHAELVSLWVRSEARGHGVATALVEAVVAWVSRHRSARTSPFQPCADRDRDGDHCAHRS